MNTTLIPVLWGPNRLQGSPEGALFDDTHTNTTESARALARREIAAAGVDVTPKLVGDVLTTILDRYTSGRAEWLSAKAGDSKLVGHVEELVFPSGHRVLVADRRILDRVGLRAGT